MGSTLALLIVLAAAPQDPPPPPLLEAPDDESNDAAPEANPVPEPDPAPLYSPTRDRWGGCQTYLTQVAVGTGTCLASIVIPFGPLLAPGGAGYAQAFIGDRYGPRRGAVIYPVITNYLFSVGSVFGFAFILTLTVSPDRPITDDNLAAVVIISGLVGLAALPNFASAAVWTLFSVPKRPGDTGAGNPGFLLPQHPKTPPPETTAPTAAMRY